MVFIRGSFQHPEANRAGSRAKEKNDFRRLATTLCLSSAHWKIKPSQSSEISEGCSPQWATASTIFFFNEKKTTKNLPTYRKKLYVGENERSDMYMSMIWKYDRFHFSAILSLSSKIIGQFRIDGTKRITVWTQCL